MARGKQDKKNWVDVLQTVWLTQSRAPLYRQVTRLCQVRDARYVERTYAKWLEYSAAIGRVPPSFDWRSVHAFHPEAQLLAFDAIPPSTADALIQFRFGHTVRCPSAPRSDLVYVSFLEVAPWNRVDANPRHTRGLGPALIRIACDASLQRGFGGRLGLHSTALAERFYENLGLRRLDCPNEHHEIYLELDEAGAGDLLSD